MSTDKTFRREYDTHYVRRDRVVPAGLPTEDQRHHGFDPECLAHVAEQREELTLVALVALAPIGAECGPAVS